MWKSEVMGGRVSCGVCGGCGGCGGMSGGGCGGVWVEECINTSISKICAECPVIPGMVTCVLTKICHESNFYSSASDNLGMVSRVKIVTVYRNDIAVHRGTSQ